MIQLFTKKRNKKGFTLIELVVVIAILGILTAIAVPKFASTQANAKNKADEATARTVQSALHLYFADDATAAAGDITLASIGSYIKTPVKWANDDEITEVTVDATGTITAFDKVRPATYN